MSNDENLDKSVVDSFGFEWKRFSYQEFSDENFLSSQFQAYATPIDLSIFQKDSAIAVDIGAGSGRWTEKLEPYFNKIIAIEPSKEACEVLNSRFNDNKKFKVLNESANLNSIENLSVDLIMSLGVLHHLPDPKAAIEYLSRKIKTGGWFWCYLYYNLENRNYLYRLAFKFVNYMRISISKMPNRFKIIITNSLAMLIYFPLSRFAKILTKLGINDKNIPLHHYKDMPIKVLFNDSYDRFATRVEHRFSKQDIVELLRDCEFDLKTLNFSDLEPLYTFAVRKL